MPSFLLPTLLLLISNSAACWPFFYFGVLLVFCLLVPLLLAIRSFELLFPLALLLVMVSYCFSKKKIKLVYLLDHDTHGIGVGKRWNPNRVLGIVVLPFVSNDLGFKIRLIPSSFSLFLSLFLSLQFFIGIGYLGFF